MGETAEEAAGALCEPENTANTATLNRLVSTCRPMKTRVRIVTSLFRERTHACCGVTYVMPAILLISTRTSLKNPEYSHKL